MNSSVDLAGKISGTASLLPNSDAHANSPLPPSAVAYGQLQLAFSFFNERLFGGILPDPLFTLVRTRGAYGYFCQQSFESVDGNQAHEISLNPAYFEQVSIEDTLSTLAHESVHLWRHDFGAANRKGGKGSRGWHDLVWASKMVEIGLQPIALGKRAGLMTGYRVTDSIVEGGPFDLACRELLIAGFRIDWHETAPTNREDGSTGGSVGADGDQTDKTRGKRKRFTCPGCGLNAWAKKSARFQCSACSAIMIITLPTKRRSDN